MVDLRTPQRQSPLAIVFLGLRVLRQLGFAQLAVFAAVLFNLPLDGPLIVLPFVVILVFGTISALAWWRYTFQLVDGELIVVKGVVSVDRLTVPVERIQSMSIEQQLLHRITGLVRLSVDTAGSSEAEFNIDAVPRPVAEELQAQAVAARPAPNGPLDTPPPPGTPLPLDAATTSEREVLRHDTNRLIKAAITTWPFTGLVVLGSLVGFGGDFLDRIPVMPDIGETSGISPWWIPLIVAGFVAFSVLLNIVRVLLQDWDLTVTASDDSLRRTSGLFSTTSKASSIDRVQVASSTQNPLQHRAGLRVAELRTIGEGDLSVLGCDDDQWSELVELAQPDTVAGPERRISPLSVFLAGRNTAVIASIAAIAGWFAVGWWSAFALVLVIPTVFFERIRVRNFRWRLSNGTDGDALATSDQVINRATQQALLRKANGVRITQSIFERRRDLAYVHLQTAAGTVSIGMIPIDDARAVRDAILASAETDSRPFM